MDIDRGWIDMSKIQKEQGKRGALGLLIGISVGITRNYGARILCCPLL